MADWKEMYLTMFRANEKAMQILEAAQQECEEMYMRDGDPERDGEDERIEEENRRLYAELDEADAQDEPDAPDNASA